LCDADVDGPLVAQLREDGHEVDYIAEIKPDSIDEEVLQAANERNAILVTRDKGFGQLVFHQRLAVHGVLLLRLAGLPMKDRRKLLSEAVRLHGGQFRGSFSVLTKQGLRIRPHLPEAPPNN
jgi:predicted nuclease of predicted toxin-antitoxin system